MRQLIIDLRLRPVSFQACMHGSRRARWSTFYTDAPWLDCLALECDGKHEHDPWTIARVNNRTTYATADEAEYPALLCSRISQAAFGAATSLGAVVPSPAKRRRVSTVQTPSKANAGRQPRGQKHPELVAEFKDVLEVSWPFAKPAKMPHMLTQEQLDHFQLSTPAKLFSCVQSGVAADENNEKKVTYAGKIGCYFEPEEFVLEACRLRHPFDGSELVDDEIKRNIFWLLTEGSLVVEQFRSQAFAHYEAIADDLQDAEDTIHAELDPAQRKVIESKKLLLVRRMCSDAGIEGDDLAIRQLIGTSLYGDSGFSNLFEPEDNEPALSVTQLMKSSRWSRKMLKSKHHSHMDEDVLSSVWQVTLQEAEAGWLEGPLDEAEVAQRCGPLFVASPRFGLVQSDKVRPIDDMSISMVNSSFAAKYKLSLDGVDGISVMARVFLEAVDDEGNVSLEFSDGSVLTGKLHESLDVSMARSICGRTLDLEAAYKQMLVSRSSLWASVLMVPDATGSKHISCPAPRRLCISICF